jgi:hypothetical protein
LEKKSGKHWVDWANSNAPNSNKLIDLEITFRANVLAFIGALEDAGALINI